MNITFWLLIGLLALSFVILGVVLLQLVSKLRPLAQAAQQLNSRAENATVLAEQLKQLEATITAAQYKANETVRHKAGSRS